ncbi:MAG: LapA family protein [Gemmatimonadetes bacterium]|nr:LapA family protein [Gemmatimonadota bacterium]
MSRGSWIGGVALALLAALFAYGNRGESAVLHLGVATFYRAPTTLLVMGSFLLGMLAMFLLGLRHDLRVRRALAERERATPIPREEYPHSWTGPDYSGSDLS